MQTASFLTSMLSADDAKDIFVGTVEARDLHTATDMEIAVARHARHVVMLEGDALRLERTHDTFHLVAHSPGERGRLVGARELRLVDQQRRAAAAVGNEVLALLADRLEAERAFV